MDYITQFGTKGYNHTQFNKIRDIESFIINSKHI